MGDQDSGGRQQAYTMEMINVLFQVQVFMLACAIGSACYCLGQFTD